MVAYKKRHSRFFHKTWPIINRPVSIDSGAVILRLQLVSPFPNSSACRLCSILFQSANFCSIFFFFFFFLFLFLYVSLHIKSSCFFFLCYNHHLFLIYSILSFCQSLFLFFFLLPPPPPLSF